jgi:regulatory protein
MGKITALKMGKRDPARVSVYLDGEYAFSLTLDDAARLREGQTLTDAEIAALKRADAVVRAVDSASRFLAARPRSVQEVRRRLMRRQFEDAVIDQALDKLQALGYLDDQAFAAFWVRERRAFKPLGARALRYELRQKGISESIIREALAHIDAEADALRAAQAQARRLRGLSRRDFWRRLSAFLQRRGFAHDEAARAIRRLQAEIEADDPSFWQPEQKDEP